MKTCLIMTGTRPEIIKMAPVYQALKHLPQLRVAWCHSGQHDTIAAQFFTFFSIEPEIVLSRPAGQDLGDLLAGLIQASNQVLRQHPVDMVLVHGDTSSALAGALAAFYRQIPVGHVEAGLRSGNPQSPFPEENNRCLLASLACRHYAPTPRARANLLRENVADCDIVLTGNSIVDAQNTLIERYQIQRQPGVYPKLLVTAHRRENWPHMAEICQSVLALVSRFETLDVVFPLHPNPQLQNEIQKWLGGHARIQLTAPLDYLALQRHLSEASLVLTDSGGIQEEAAGFRVPALVMRDNTERAEAVEAGMADLVGTDCERIVAAATRWLSGEKIIAEQAPNPFGDGQASGRIARDVLDFVFRENGAD